MDDDTRRAMSILAKAVFKLRSDEDLDEAHATELRALAWPPKPPTPSTVDVLGSELRVGDVVVASRHRGDWRNCDEPARVQPSLLGWGDDVTYRVRLPRPSTVDVLGSELRVGDVVVGWSVNGDVWSTDGRRETLTELPAGRWPHYRVRLPRPSTVDVLGSELRVGDVVVGNGSVTVVQARSHWNQRVTYRVRLPRPDVAPSVAVDAPADALLPSWVDVEALAREEQAAWTEGRSSWESITSELRKAWCTTARTVATAVLRMQRDAQQTSAGSLAKASPSTSRGADGPTEPRTSTQPDVPGALARLWSAYGHAGSARAELRLVFSLLGAAPPNEDEPGMHSPRPKKHGRKI